MTMLQRMAPAEQHLTEAATAIVGSSSAVTGAADDMNGR